MKAIKWEQFKEKCAKYAYNKTDFDYFSEAISRNFKLMRENYQPKTAGEAIKEVKDEVWEMIMRTDIRNAKALFDTFPKLTPDWLKSRQYVADIDEQGDWALFPLN